MKSILLILTFLIILAIELSAQTKTNPFYPKDNEKHVCRKLAENKAVGLSFNTSDTLSIAQLKKSTKITTNMVGEKIIFYRLSYSVYGGTDIIEINETSNKLSAEVIESIITSHTEKIYLEEVTGENGNLIGSRSFILK